MFIFNETWYARLFIGYMLFGLMALGPVLIVSLILGPQSFMFWVFSFNIYGLVFGMAFYFVVSLIQIILEGIK